MIGKVFYISADSSALGLDDYNVRIASMCTIEEIHNDKVIVIIDDVDGDRNVMVSINKDIFNKLIIRDERLFI